MKSWVVRSILLIVIAGLAAIAFSSPAGADGAKPQAAWEQDNVRFAWVELIVDSGDKPLAAYQLDFKLTSETVRIVGIEGGAHKAFNNPPYYDPRAMQHERVIIGAFSTNAAAELPTGETRVASIQLMVIGDVQPTYAVELTACATAGGEKIAGKIRVRKGTTP